MYLSKLIVGYTKKMENVNICKSYSNKPDFKKRAKLLGKMVYKAKLSLGEYYYHSKGQWRQFS